MRVHTKDFSAAFGHACLQNYHSKASRCAMRLSSKQASGADYSKVCRSLTRVGSDRKLYPKSLTASWSWNL